MGERFTGQRCHDCQGGLQYVKSEKYWECPYCGKIYERELRFNKVQIDGLAGINDVVRSTLSKLLTLDFSGAEKDLTECEKLDHASVVTLIAKISFSLFKSFYTKDRQTELNKVNALLPKLSRDFSGVEEAEEILYDFIDSADIYALLFVVFSMTGQTERKTMISNMMEVEEVFNANIARHLINIMLKDGRIEDADILLDNIAASNCKYGLMSTLTMYPAGERKAQHIGSILDKLGSEVDVGKLFDDYFESGADTGDTIVEVFLTAVAHKVNFNTVKVIDSVLSNCTNVETATKTFDALSAKRLDEETANTILHWALLKCHQAEISKIAFESLFKSNSVFEITDDNLISVFTSELTEDVKQQKIAQLLSTFKISAKNVDRALAFHMIENQGSSEYRKMIFDQLVERVTSIPLTLLEEYILGISYDKEYKADFLRASFKKLRMASILSGVFSKYLRTDIDTPEIREKVILIFLENQLIPDSDAAGYYLANPAELRSDTVLDILNKKSCKVASDTMDQYIANLSDYKTFNYKIAELATKFSFVISVASLRKFLLCIPVKENKKIPLMSKFLGSCNGDLRSIEMQFKAGEVNVVGNLAQVYFFTSADDPYVIQEVVALMERCKIKMDEPLEPVGGKKIKIKKFIEANESKLDNKIITLAEHVLK